MNNESSSQTGERGIATLTPEFQFLEERGYYTKAADIIDLGKKDRHLDIASGDGRLLAELRQRQKNAFLAGIDINHKMLIQAMMRMTSNDIDACIHNPGRRVRKISTQRNPVHLICDDIENTDFLDEEIGKRPLDSVSLTSPTTSIDEECDTILSLVTERVKPGGKFLIDRRVVTLQDPMSSDEIWGYMRKMMTGFLKYWERGQNDFLMVEADPTIAKKTLPSSYSAMQANNFKLGFPFQIFERNDRPYLKPRKVALDKK